MLKADCYLDKKPETSEVVDTSEGRCREQGGMSRPSARYCVCAKAHKLGTFYCMVAENATFRSAPDFPHHNGNTDREVDFTDFLSGVADF